MRPSVTIAVQQMSESEAKACSMQAAENAMDSAEAIINVRDVAADAAYRALALAGMIEPQYINVTIHE